MKYLFDPARNYHAYPEITKAARNRKRARELRVYYLLYDKVTRRENDGPLTIQSAYMIARLRGTLTYKEFDRIIRSGGGDFWVKDTLRADSGYMPGTQAIRLLPPEEVAAALGLRRPGPRLCRLVADLLSKEHRAKTWEYVRNYEILRANMPVSQQRLRERTGTAERTQRLYKSQLGDHGFYNYEIMMLCDTVQEAHEHYEVGIKFGWYKKHKHEIKVLSVTTADGSTAKVIGIFRRLPKLYRYQQPPMGCNDIALVAKHIHGAYTSGVYYRISEFVPPSVGDTVLVPFRGPTERSSPMDGIVIA